MHMTVLTFRGKTPRRFKKKAIQDTTNFSVYEQILLRMTDDHLGRNKDSEYMTGRVTCSMYARWCFILTPNRKSFNSGVKVTNSLT